MTVNRPQGMCLCVCGVGVCVHMRGFHSTYGGDEYGMKRRGDRDGKTKNGCRASPMSFLKGGGGGGGGKTASRAERKGVSGLVWGTVSAVSWTRGDSGKAWRVDNGGRRGG